MSRDSGPLVVGAVAYDPKVVTIWEGFVRWFASRGLELDYVLYRTYESQVLGLLAGEHHVAWNSPLAWVQTRRMAAAAGRRALGFAMRDTDRDLHSVVVGLDRGPSEVGDLRGTRVGVGAYDSPQATLIPLQLLADSGLVPGRDFEVVVFDVLAGKHGDHVGGERDAARALAAGHLSAVCVMDANHLAFAAEGTLPAGRTRILARTAPYDHCIFTALDGGDLELMARFAELLFAMDWQDPAVRPLLELEGLRRWEAGRTTGFAQLERAVDQLDFAGAQAVRDFVAGGRR